jgi:hypothetical protein
LLALFRTIRRAGRIASIETRPYDETNSTDMRM